MGAGYPLVADMEEVQKGAPQGGGVHRVLHQLVVLAAEALPVLEKQLMDPRGPGDIRVSP